MPCDNNSIFWSKKNEYCPTNDVLNVHNSLQGYLSIPQLCIQVYLSLKIKPTLQGYITNPFFFLSIKDPSHTVSKIASR
jgi:hypothetical protein